MVIYVGYSGEASTYILLVLAIIVFFAKLFYICLKREPGIDSRYQPFYSCRCASWASFPALESVGVRMFILKGRAGINFHGSSAWELPGISSENRTPKLAT